MQPICPNSTLPDITVPIMRHFHSCTLCLCCPTPICGSIQSTDRVSSKAVHSARSGLFTSFISTHCWQKGGICMVSILVAHVSFGTHLQHTTHQYVLHRINQVFSVSGALTWKTWSFQLDTNRCCCNFGLVHKDESIIWWVHGFRCFISLWVMIQSRNTATKSYPPFFLLLQC
jgi:hypothetical protein